MENVGSKLVTWHTAQRFSRELAPATG